MFANLRGNAVKYTRPREAAVIEIGSAGEEAGLVIVFVRDNGEGATFYFTLMRSAAEQPE